MYTVMIIDDNLANLTIAKNCLQDTYNILPASSGARAFAMLEKIIPDLILLDIKMPDMNGFEVISRLKTSTRYKDIPVIFLTGQEGNIELEGLNLGAVDFIKKPFSIPILKKRVAIHLQLIDQRRKLEAYSNTLLEQNSNLQMNLQEKEQSILNLERALISIVTDLIEGKDGYTGGHVARTAKIMRAFMKELYRRGMMEDIREEDIDMVALFSKLHDVGKIGIPESVLLKTGVLTTAELMQMRLHTIFGSNAIEKSMKITGYNQFLYYAMQMAHSHHEWWDGTGYPEKLAGTSIPLVARITAICDSYDAIRSRRSYQNERTHEEALTIIKNSSRTQFDPSLAAVFIEIPLQSYE